MLYARQWCTSPDDALQDALIDLTQQSRVPSDVVGWLFKAVRFKAINQSRSDQRRSRHQQLAAAQRDDWFDFDPTAAMQSQELESFLVELEPLAREIVVARIWGEMSFEQITDLVDRPLSTVHRHYQRALKSLESKLNGNVKQE